MGLKRRRYLLTDRSDGRLVRIAPVAASDWRLTARSAEGRTCEADVSMIGAATATHDVQRW